MKKFIVILLCLGLYGCPFVGEAPFPDEGSKYKPVILKRADFEKSIALEKSKQIEKSAKIYIYDTFIFINDKHKGFHLFNNSNPKNPVKEKFLKIPGATDIAIRDNMMYINQATDLIALSFDYSNLTYKLEKRVRNVFPQIIAPDGFRYHELKKDEVIVGWVSK